MLFIFLGINKTYSQKDSVLVTTLYSNVIDNGIVTKDIYPVWQKTNSISNRPLRTVFYSNSDMDYELYYHYKDNKNYLTEKYKDGSIIGYTLFEQKGKKSIISEYKIEEKNDILLSKTISKKKKNTTYQKKYNNDNKVIYTKDITLLNNSEAIKESFLTNDSLKGRTTTIEYNPENSTDTLSKKIILNYTDRNDTITFSYKYNNNILRDVTEKHNNNTYTTTYRFYEGGSLKSYRKMDNKRKFYSYYTYDLKWYYRVVPSVKPHR